MAVICKLPVLYRQPRERQLRTVEQGELFFPHIVELRCEDVILGGVLLGVVLGLFLVEICTHFDVYLIYLGDVLLKLRSALVL